MPLRLRGARSEDFHELYALDQACFAPGIAWSKAELGYFLRYPGNIVLLAEDENSVLAGFAIAGTQRRSGARVARLITIDVRADMRRQGVGHALLTSLEGNLRAAEAKAILLEVAVDNSTALQFYARHGFVQTGRIPGYYNGRIDALVMEKPL